MNEPASPIGNELDLRALRYFVAAAEELHFTRAAARLFVAQQALSREIARLERRLGTPLFTRTTRRVTLTPTGERLLERARELLALHDRTWHELRPAARTVVVDLLSEGRRTGLRVLEAVRLAHPELDFRGGYGGGMARSIGRLVVGELDVAFGRVEGLGRALPASLEARGVRNEPLALLLPDGHALAGREAIPLRELAGLEVDVNLDDPASPEWSDLARQVLALADARSAPPHPAAVGAEEASHHLRRQGLPILTGLDHADVPGGVLRPIVDPVPLCPWSIVWRRAAEPDPGVLAVIDAASRLAAEHGWLEQPPDAWLPEPERRDAGSISSAGGPP
ncbi:MAG TPA: LysR family transcriptional regulator [Candidatus Limnocylindrales bacterium]|nr:LysR family transcriptional regulator [Candidatus Limnocylindrales bacterium]